MARWLRCGPDRQYPPRDGEDVFIDGEGQIHRFQFEDGQVHYRSRWVRTERFVAQEKAARARSSAATETATPAI